MSFLSRWNSYGASGADAQREAGINTSGSAALAELDDYRPTVTVVVVIRWLLLGAWFVVLHYRIDRDSDWVLFNLFGVGIALLNAYVTWRIVTVRSVTWRHALAQSVADLAVITGTLSMRHGFYNDFYIFYYPALLGLSLMFPGRASFSAVAVVMVLYVIVAYNVVGSHATLQPKLELTFQQEFKQEKVLFIRIMTMVAMVAAGTLINGWERARRREAVAGERQRAEENLELQRKAQQAELAATEERSRIAREIHDGIAQSIYTLSLQLETCVELAARRSEDVKRRLEDLVGLSKETLLEVRHYIFDLKPYLAGEKGVASMLESQIREFGNVAGIPTSLDISGEQRQVPTPVATCLFRVTQEALANAFKHAQATSVKIRLDFAVDQVQLSVQDDGQGFDPVESPSGYGLHNMRARAEESGGSLKLMSSPGKGTQVEISIPC